MVGNPEALKETAEYSQSASLKPDNIAAFIESRIQLGGTNQQMGWTIFCFYTKLLKKFAPEDKRFTCYYLTFDLGYDGFCKKT